MRKKAKKYTQALRELKYTYTKKKWLKFRIKQGNTRGSLNFRSKGMKYFGPLKTNWKFSYICPVVGETDGILTSKWIMSQLSKNMSLKLLGRRCFLLRYITLLIWNLIISSNFRIRKLTKIGLACASKGPLETILITHFWRLIKRLRV